MPICPGPRGWTGAPAKVEHVSSRYIAERRSTLPSVVISYAAGTGSAAALGVVPEEAGIQKQVVQLKQSKPVIPRVPA